MEESVYTPFGIREVRGQCSVGGCIWGSGVEVCEGGMYGGRCVRDEHEHVNAGWWMGKDLRRFLESGWFYHVFSVCVCVRMFVKLCTPIFGWLQPVVIVMKIVLDGWEGGGRG